MLAKASAFETLDQAVLAPGSKELRRLRHRSKAFVERKLNIIRARENDAARVAGWIETDEVLQAIGGNPGEDKAAQVRSWISNSRGAFFLTVDTHPVAFMTVEPLLDGNTRTDHLELGRVIVAPEARMKGHGATLLLHVIHRAHAWLKGKPLAPESALFLRVNKNNPAGTKFIQRVPVREVGDPRYGGFRQSRSNWFVYRPRGSSLGPIVKSRLAISERRSESLAFSSNLSEQMIRAIVGADRSPSPDVFRDMAAVLSNNDFEFTQLMYAYFEEPVPPLLKAVASTRPIQIALAQQDTNIWLISDVIAELRYEGVDKASADAVRRGFGRRYFIPSGDTETLRKIEGVFKDLPAAIKHKLLRVYFAPRYLCYLRILLLNPEPQGAHEVSVAGPDDTRIAINQDVAKTLTGYIFETARALDREPLASVDGFSLQYPTPEMTQES